MAKNKTSVRNSFILLSVISAVVNFFIPFQFLTGFFGERVVFPNYYLLSAIVFALSLFLIRWALSLRSKQKIFILVLLYVKMAILQFLFLLLLTPFLDYFLVIISIDKFCSGLVKWDDYGLSTNPEIFEACRKIQQIFGQ